MPVVAIEHDGALILLDIVLVIDIQRVGELRFKPRVTLSDVEGIRVVGDVEQLGDIRLTGIAAIMEPDVMLVAELIVEVDGGSEIDHIADGIHIDAAIVLNEIRALGLYEESQVIIVLLLSVT